MQKKETLFFVYRNHFVVNAKERNTSLYAQETLCCLCKRQKHCFLSTEITLLFMQKKETLFSVHRKHFVVCAKERNTVLYAKETCCCPGKRKKHCFLCIEKKHCSLWMRNTFSFSTGNKVFLFHGHKRKQLPLLLFTALEIRIHDVTSNQLFFSTMADEQDKETNHLFSKIFIKSN